ncbi:MAG TPA: hypothetical protein VE985_02445 [Gaiellaceae bacterium]|nr:hypothetical protein [Gaiellaceae bacterium]
MPTRKQRRRVQKERRHEYETVWVDEEGNELEEPPENLAPKPEKRDEAAPKARATQKQERGRGGRPVRVPPPPSWRRAVKRSLIIGAAIFAFFYILSKNGHHNLGTALALAVVYTVLFIPFTYTIDRFAYNRWQRRADQGGQKGSARKR